MCAWGHRTTEAGRGQPVGGTNFLTSATHEEKIRLLSTQASSHRRKRRLLAIRSRGYSSIAGRREATLRAFGDTADGEQPHASVIYTPVRGPRWAVPLRRIGDGTPARVRGATCDTTPLRRFRASWPKPLGRGNSGWRGDAPHPVPRRMLVIPIQGEVEVTAGDGTTRRFKPGDVVIAEDTWGSGHATRITGDVDSINLFIELLDTVQEQNGSQLSQNS